MAQPSRADPADELQTEECDEEGLDASFPRGAGTPQDEGEEDDDVPHTRNWHYRTIIQKTLTGEITLRKWVTDQSPQYTARRGASELQSHLCSFHDCGKAFPDASALRKHMHTHGEKQYICQVEVRRQPAPAVSPWLVRALSRRPSPPFHPHPPLSLAGVRQAVPRQLQTEATLAHAHGGAASPLPLRGVREALLASLQPALAHVHPHGRAPVRVHLSRRGARSTRRARRVRHARGPPRLPQPTRPPQRAAAPVLPRAPALTLMRCLSLSCGQAATSGMRRRTPWRRT